MGINNPGKVSGLFTAFVKTEENPRDPHSSKVAAPERHNEDFQG